MVRQNYPKKHPNTVCSKYLAATSRDTIDSRGVSKGLSDIPTLFQENIDQVLELKTPVWLHDIIYVTNVTIEDHERE